MTNDLPAILTAHAAWLRGEPDGKRAVLRGADLHEAKLHGADLHGADLRYADMSYAKLRGADLRGADLSGADLSGANLIGADLREANLSGADLSGANLSGADIILVGQTVGGHLVYAYPNEDNVVVGRAGCQTFFGIHAALDYVENSDITDPIEREDMLSLIDRCRRMATARGWKLEAAKGGQDE